MKQTNNAIKFLMAQYRAIFKNANIAMLAAIAASALAAGQAQAAKPFTNTELGQLTGEEGTITIDGSGDGASNKYQNLTLTGPVAQNAKFEGLTFLIQSGAATANTIKGTGADAAAIVDLTGATITLDVDPKGSTIKGNNNLAVGNDATNATTLKVSELNVVKGTLSTVASNSVKNSIEAVNINVGKETGGDADVTVGKSGSVLASGKLTINKNSTITIGDSATLTGGNIIVNDGTINVSGANASAVFGSATSSIEIKSGTIVDAASASGKVFGKTITLTDGVLESANKLTIEAAKDGEFNANGGEIKVAPNNSLTLKGTANINQGAKLSNSGTLVVTGKTTISDKATFALGDNGLVQITGDDQGADDAAKTSTLTISKATFGTLTKGATQKVKASGAAGTHAVLSFTDDKINLVDDGIIKNDALDAEKLVIEGAGDFKIFADTMELKRANVNSDKLIVAGNNVTVGTAGAFEVNGGSKLEVGKALTIDGSGANKLTITSGGLILNGTPAAALSPKTILLGAGSVGEATLDVKKGDWTVTDLTLQSGTANIFSGASLTVAGVLTSSGDSSLTISGGGTLSTVGSGSLAYKDAAANKLVVEAGGTLKLDADDILKTNALNENLVKAGAISGAGVIVIGDKTTSAISKDEFEAFTKKFGNFSGVYKMNVNVGTLPAKLTPKDVLTNLETDAYNDSTLYIPAGDVAKGLSGNYSVGNVQVETDSELKLITAKGALTLHKASADNGNFVSKQSGSATVVAGVNFGEPANSLTLIGQGNIGAITVATGAAKGIVNVGYGENAGNVTVKGTKDATAGIGAAGIDAVKELNLAVGSSLVVEHGDVFANSFNMLEGTSAKVNGDITTSSLQVLGNSLSANTLTLSDGGSPDPHQIAGGANVTLTGLTIGKNQALAVGQAGDGTPDSLGSSAKVYTGSLKMNATGSSIFVDPNYGTGASLFATDKIGDNGSTVSGKVGIGSNSAFGVGFASMAEFEETLSPYLTNNGGFDKNGSVKNALVLNKPVTIGDDKGITVDSELKATELDTKVLGNTLTLGAGAALIVTKDALASDGAVKFAASSGKVEAADDGSSLVIFAADVTKQDSGKRVFGANTAVDTALKGQAAGGLLDVTFEQNGTITLKNNDKRLGEMRQHISEPTTQLFADYRDGKFAGAVGSLGYKFVYESLTAPGDAYKAVDIAAHAATYAGAQQAAVAAVTTMADAMFGRVGAVGVEAATIAATGSQANGGVWLTPMYKSVDSDGFGAQGGSYGADVNLSGVAFGTDTVNGNMRFGAVFNIGSGDTEGKGLGNGLKDEFDYYGFGIYSAMGFGNFALVGDASMTVISHEVEGLGLKGKADTTAVTMGLTGQYTVATPMVDVTPHLGARFIRLNTDSYDLVSADGVLATTDFDVQNVFSVPLGVTLSKAFVAGGWTLAPSADLTIAFNTGDTEAKSSNQFTGIKAYEYSTEVLDEVQYGLTVGLGAQYGAFGTSFGINYTGSDNTDSFGVNAQCRYMF
ncbi:beta strand repeat-containing protein [Anaerobiospirillum succiniciproducens]|uniref:beta strand repeat-containing protein n=1 Tax=Anaerobiospirillum succiniciproducens TaxID=13335 RepID=UPI003F8AC800